ncbi:MAG TPA: RNA 2',3'-cyclic phosphodiesterase, partial [Longimicrobium sp.]|jgi:2'-5' RNA ligase
MPETSRLFLGIPVDDATRAGLGEWLGPARLPGRPVTPANWHLTLRFLGDTPMDQQARLTEALAAANLGARFTLEFGGLGAFPRPQRAAVLWLGVTQGDRELRRVAATTEEVVRAAGFPADRKSFSPHLTLARIQPPPRDISALVAASTPWGARMEVAEAVLFRSHLGGGPPRYERVASFPLAP